MVVAVPNQSKDLIEQNCLLGNELLAKQLGLFIIDGRCGRVRNHSF